MHKDISAFKLVELELGSLGSNTLMCIILVHKAHLFVWRNPSGVDPGCWCSADECESGGFKWCLHSDAWHCFNIVISNQKEMVLYGSVVCYC